MELVLDKDYYVKHVNLQLHVASSVLSSLGKVWRSASKEHKSEQLSPRDIAGIAGNN